MASFAMHYAIAKKYCAKNKSVDFAEFLKGSLQPDLAQDKNKSHYTKPSKTQTVEEIVKNKVDLIECVKNTTLNSDFAMGEFLHLLTDRLYFKELQKAFRKINVTDLTKVVALLVEDYTRTNGILAEKYQIDLMQFPENSRGTSKLKPVLMDINQIEDFFELCANIDLVTVYKKIKNNQEPF